MKRERVSNHTLMVWRKRVEGMSDLDKRLLKPLYAGLKQLTAEEREFLMQKYYYPDKPYTDKEMAEQTGLSVGQYGSKRRRIEAKLVVDNDEKIPY
ncbi:hypothetical protein [Carnobacterium sp. FSL W8-0810]|uniref:hypothetical protein n=1 Tax=Carnobacterium sp. FSL W8-0810 TaxID=2954705 RepID=UPI0030F52E9B